MAIRSVIDKIVKIIPAIAIAIILVLLTSPNIADARGGCFGGNTPILTREGSIPISRLHPGDRILGYNFTTDRLEDEQIGNIQVIQSPDYYLINQKISVTATHPFYIQTATGIDLVEVKNLKLGDRLLSRSSDRSSSQIVTRIDRINQPITVYNLLAITPDHNFYADGILVHNKGGSGGGGGGSGGGSSYGHNWSNGDRNQQTSVRAVYSFMLAIVVMFATMTSVVMYREIYNFIRFSGKKFTDDRELINFVLAINSEYTNCYSIGYRQDREIWKTIPAQAEVDEAEYCSVITKSALIDRFTQLFNQYQTDWTNKSFDAMTDYLEPGFYNKQARVFKNDFGNNFDIVYHPEILEITPINYDSTPLEHIFKIQIDAQMVNFEVSTKGYILSGEAAPRSFTEYWTISIDNDRKFWLVDIATAKAVKKYQIPD